MIRSKKPCEICLRLISLSNYNKHYTSHFRVLNKPIRKEAVKRVAWNKGQTKENNASIRQYAETLKQKYANKELVPKGCCTSEYNTSEIGRKNASRGGGYRESAGRSKKYWVVDTFGKLTCLQSSYELKCSKILNELNISWIRPGHLKYDDTKKYFADFYLPEYDIFLDPKNDYKRILDQEKITKVRNQNNVRLYVLSEIELTCDTITELCNSMVE